MSRHWTLDELTDRLYGIREQDTHLESCRECTRRYEDLIRRRAAAAFVPEMPSAQRAAQRSAVLDRIASPSVHVPRWVPALTAGACLLAIAVFEYRPMRITPPVVETGTTAAAVTASDAQLFADIYSLEESAEPRAAAPIHELFEEGQP